MQIISWLPSEIKVRAFLLKNSKQTIFERYYRVKPVENGGAEGIGLGLSISKRIVEWHCGNLYAQNSEEGGAVFVIELPFPGRVPPGQS
jgi:signal transduction histidine kinase